MNTLKTAFLLTALTLFLIFIGGFFGGRNGMILAFIIAAGMNFFSYFYSDKMALSLYRAQPVTREQLPRVYQIVERILPRMALPMPRIYVIPTDSPNAFATGRNPKHAAVAVTQGILNLLNDEELEGVLAHELGHVKNRDILTSSVAATLAGAITLLAQTASWAGLFGGLGAAETAVAAWMAVGSSCSFWPPLRLPSSSWPFPGPGNMRPTPPGLISPETPMLWPARCRSSTLTPGACPCRHLHRPPTYLLLRPF